MQKMYTHTRAHTQARPRKKCRIVKKRIGDEGEEATWGFVSLADDRSVATRRLQPRAWLSRAHMQDEQMKLKAASP